ncbi:hypothetical protein [Luteitalea sp.]|uniref:hypothetical protein n=1 Tax=Luteitalea sp. TaxID=2004800 RepID=UPI0025C4CCBF|nr:hypothetical protein [Luteitalea sp.]
MKRVDEDGWPEAPGEIRELGTGTPHEVVEYRMPLRLPYRRGRRLELVVRAWTATARVTLAVE